MNSDCVGAYEAKTKFSEILERVANGEEIIITRHGVSVARLVPVNKRQTPASRLETIQQLRALGERNKLAGLNLKDLIAEGRR